MLGLDGAEASLYQGSIQGGIGSVHAVKTGSLGVGLGGSGTAEPGINGGVQHGDDFLSLEHDTADAAVAALGQAVAGLGGSHSGVGHRSMAGCVDVRLFGDLAALLADLALLALLGAGGVLQDLEITILVLAAGKLLDKGINEVGDLAAQIIDLVLDNVVDLVAHLIADPVSQLAGQELVDGIVHLVIGDIAGTAAQLVDLIGHQAADGQQVGLQTVQHLLVGPALADPLRGLVGSRLDLGTDAVHKGGVVDQLLFDLGPDLLHGGGTQLGLQQHGVFLILHDLVQGQLHSVVHQGVGQGIPALVTFRHVADQLQHHVLHIRHTVGGLFLVVLCGEVINGIVHRIVDQLFDAGLRCGAGRHIGSQLVHQAGNGLLGQEAVVQATLQAVNGSIQRLQDVFQVLRVDTHILVQLAYTDLHTGQLALYRSRDLVQGRNGFFLGLGLLYCLLGSLQGVVDDLVGTLVSGHVVHLHSVHGPLGSLIYHHVLVECAKFLGSAAAIVAGALVLGGNAQNLIEALISGVLVGQGVAAGAKVGPVFRVRSGAALPGAVGRLGLLLAAGLVVVYILAPDMAQGRVGFCISLVNVLLVAAIPLAHLIPLAGGGAGGGLNDPLCALKIMAQGRVGFCIAFLYHLVVAAAALADLVLFSGSGAGSLHHDPVAHIVVQGRFEIIFFCCRAADSEDVILTLVNGISLLRASRGNCFFFLPFMLMFL